MARLIDADALIKAMGVHTYMQTEWTPATAWGVPIIDAEPVKHGYWIEEPIEDEWGKLPSIWHCSKCDNLELNNSPYCPNCGAKMDEVDDGRR